MRADVSEAATSNVSSGYANCYRDFIVYYVLIFKNIQNWFATTLVTNSPTYLHRIHNNYAFGDVFNQHYQDCNQGCPCQQKFIRFNTHSHSPPFAAKATAQNATGGENVPFCMPNFPTIEKPRFKSTRPNFPTILKPRFKKTREKIGPLVITSPQRAGSVI